MATAHSRAAHRPTRFSIRPIAFALVATTTALAGIVAGAGATQAAPQLSISQVQSRINALNTQAEKITERYDAAREKLGTLQQQAHIAAIALGRANTKLGGLQKRISATAVSAYRTAGISGSVFEVTSDPQAFLDQASMLDALSRAQAEQLAGAAAASHDVKVAQTTYTARAAAVRQTLRSVAQDRQHIQALLASAHALLSSLKASQRAALAAAAVSTAAQQVALRGSYHGPASGQAAEAVKFAYAQLGKPYQYGAAGPSSYDCSGLTMAAWGAAGVGLPHNAAMQQSDTHYVSEGDLQPGDLTFFGSPAYHVAIYIGGGRIIEAPHTGDVVKIVSLSAMPDYSGAGRP